MGNVIVLLERKSAILQVCSKHRYIKPLTASIIVSVFGI